MSTYLIGDIHGCYISLKNILKKISFNIHHDTLWMTGDLVSKGPKSLEVLKLVYSIKDNVKIVLGNHDLNLLKMYSNINHKHKKQYTSDQDILQLPYSNKLITWLRHQPMIQVDEEKKIIMTHAGISPSWNIHQTKKFSKEIENFLQNEDYSILLNNIDTRQKIITNNKLITSDIVRMQININIFTKMRYILPNGTLDMEYKDIPEKAPKSLIPWFNIPGLIVPKYNIIFGHWSSLQGQGTPQGIYGLDSGCYQGRKLTVLQWENKKFTYMPCNPNCL